MAYVQCRHCRRGAAYSPNRTTCARCGAPLPHPAGCSTPSERHLQLLSEPTRSLPMRPGHDTHPLAA